MGDDRHPSVEGRVDGDIRYRAVERVVGIEELGPFIDEAIAELGAGDGDPFAIYHGPVNETSRSLIEVGVPDSTGDRVIEGGRVLSAVGPLDADYDSIHVVYDTIADAIRAGGLAQRGQTREVYRADGIEIVWPVRER